MDMEKSLNEQIKNTTTLLGFLITQPQLINADKEQIMSMNLLRLKCTKMWTDNMIKEVESKCKKETLETMNKLFKHITINK